MKNESTKYGLRNKKTHKLVQCDVKSNEGAPDAGSTEYSLSDLGDDGDWLVDSAEHAEWVRLNPTEWYNAGHDTPSHNLSADDYEVVRVEIVQEITKVDPKLPTELELAEIRYKEKEPGHLDYLKKNYFDTGVKVGFSWYDYSSVLREIKEREILEELSALQEGWVSRSASTKKSQDARDTAKWIAELYARGVSGEYKIQQIVNALNVLIKTCEDAAEPRVVWYIMALGEIKKLGRKIQSRKIQTIKL